MYILEYLLRSSHNTLSSYFISCFEFKETWFWRPNLFWYSAHLFILRKITSLGFGEIDIAAFWMRFLKCFGQDWSVKIDTDQDYLWFFFKTIYDLISFSFFTVKTLECFLVFCRDSSLSNGKNYDIYTVSLYISLFSSPSLSNTHTCIHTWQESSEEERKERKSELYIPSKSAK